MTYVAVSALAGDAYGAKPVARVSIDFTRNQVRVPVSVNGSEAFSLILDTGMPTRGVLLRPTPRVDALGLKFPGAESSLSGGGSGPAVAARVAPAERIQVGEHEIAEVPVIVLPKDAGLPRDVDGVIGAELFDRFVVRVDVDAERLELFDPATYQPPSGSSAVPLRLRDRVAFVDARVTLGSQDAVTADLAVDLGAGHALWLNGGSNPKLAAPPGAIETTIGRGLSGPILGSIGRVRRVVIGDFAFENVVTVFPVREHQNPGGYDFKDGFVGAELLTRFIVTFDYSTKRMLLERGSHFDDPFEYDMTGMVLNPQGIDRRRVDSVLTGSPAEEAGVMEGDVLVAVDGQSLASLGMDALRSTFQRDGAEVVVTLERDSNTIEKRFKLRRLI
jgi:hypothetical protein